MQICLIPAKSGSKRVKNKNILTLNGKKIINITLQNILQYKNFKRIYVSSNSTKILQLCIKSNKIIKIKRKRFFCKDNTPTIDVIKDFIASEKINKKTDICVIYPTCCLVKKHHLAAGYKNFKKKKSSVFMPVVKFESAIERALTINNNNKIMLLKPQFKNTPTQDFRDYYYDSSSFYWAKCATWQKIASLYQNAHGIIIPQLQTVDVNTYGDLKKLKLILESQKKT